MFTIYNQRVEERYVSFKQRVFTRANKKIYRRTNFIILGTCHLHRAPSVMFFFLKETFFLLFQSFLSKQKIFLDKMIIEPQHLQIESLTTCGLFR